MRYEEGREGAAGDLPARGSALLFVLLALSSLSLLALLAVFSAQTDLFIAARMKKEGILTYEAEAQLDGALASLNAPTAPNIPEGALSPPWREMETVHETSGAGRRTAGWCLAPLPDIGNRDGDDLTPFVLFNREFGYRGSPVQEGGCPVFQVEVRVEEENAARGLVAEVTPRCLSPVVPAAWFAAGGLSLEGMISVSGLDHDAGGIVGEGRSGDLPGILSAGPVTLSAGIHVVGEPAGVQRAGSGEALPGDPLEVLNGGETLTSLDELPGVVDGEPMQGMNCLRESYAGPLRGEGVLVIHNPLFRPGPYEASRLFSEEGIVTPEYDPAYSHLDAELQPARLDIREGGTFSGLVVADALGPVLDAATIRGGLVTLSRSPREVRASAPLDIRYSSFFIDRASRGPLARRLARKFLERLPEEPCLRRNSAVHEAR